MNWYGGSYSAGSEYPIQKFVYKNFGYVPDSRNFNERYWLNSRGICIFVDYDVPLFVDQNSIEANHICFTAKMNLPYSTRDTTFNFNYKIGFSANARRTHINVINRFFKTPKGRPDKYLVKNPIRTFGSNINEKGVKNLITDIQQKYWYNRMFIIDGVDKSCHGSLAIDKNRFPNMKILVTDIKKRFKGAIVALLVDPFISCTVNLEFTRNNNYLVKSMDGNIIWWKIHPNSTQSAQVDFSNLNAANWYRNQLKKLKEESGFDTFKFATGFPQDPHISKSNYSILAAEFGTDVTVRMGWKTQGLNVFTEVNLLLPNYSVNDGLKSLIPKLINSNMQGYNFIYPGNCLLKFHKLFNLFKFYF